MSPHEDMKEDGLSKQQLFQSLFIKIVGICAESAKQLVSPVTGRISSHVPP